jgi:hypothetical protein
MNRYLLLLVVGMSISRWCFSQNDKLEILVENNTSAEVQARSQLEELIGRYNISGWLFAKKIKINDKEFIPFSHPVLTLNSRYLDRDAAQLATLLHEEFHWSEEANQSAFHNAIAEFKKLYPDAPADSKSGGARDKHSTYLHLIICDLEFRSLMAVTDEPTAKATLNGWKHYAWIYDKVLHDADVHKVNEANGLTIDHLKALN